MIDSDLATKFVSCVVVDDYCVLKQLLFVDVVIVVVMFFIRNYCSWGALFSNCTRGVDIEEAAGLTNQMANCKRDRPLTDTISHLFFEPPGFRRDADGSQMDFEEILPICFVSNLGLL